MQINDLNINQSAGINSYLKIAYYDRARRNGPLRKISGFSAPLKDKIISKKFFTEISLIVKRIDGQLIIPPLDSQKLLKRKITFFLKNFSKIPFIQQGKTIEISEIINSLSPVVNLSTYKAYSLEINYDRPIELEWSICKNDYNVQEIIIVYNKNILGKYEFIPSNNCKHATSMKATSIGGFFFRTENNFNQFLLSDENLALDFPSPTSLFSSPPPPTKIKKLNESENPYSPPLIFDQGPSLSLGSILGIDCPDTPTPFPLPNTNFILSVPKPTPLFSNLPTKRKSSSSENPQFPSSTPSLISSLSLSSILGIDCPDTPLPPIDLTLDVPTATATPNSFDSDIFYSCTPFPNQPSIPNLRFEKTELSTQPILNQKISEFFLKITWLTRSGGNASSSPKLSQGLKPLPFENTLGQRLILHFQLEGEKSLLQPNFQLNFSLRPEAETNDPCPPFLEMLFQHETDPSSCNQLKEDFRTYEVNQQNLSRQYHEPTKKQKSLRQKKISDFCLNKLGDANKIIVIHAEVRFLGKYIFRMQCNQKIIFEALIKSAESVSKISCDKKAKKATLCLALPL